MKAKDVMTGQVITIRPDTRVREIALLMLQRRISGVPVVDHDVVVGVVSEADLLHRHEIGTDRKGSRDSWWMRLLAGDPGPTDYVKSHAARAADIMAHPAVCISDNQDVADNSDDLDVADIARIFLKRGIKRLPVLREDRLVGIVTRADLVRALASRIPPTRGRRTQTDHGIRDRLVAELSSHRWWPSATNVTVADGIVHYWGIYETEQGRMAARVAAENVPGVKRVDDHRIAAARLPMG
jgi:CBS domain-containing protein